MFHWHARLMEYIVLHADNIDALSMILLLRNGTNAAKGTEMQSQWQKALNNIKAYLKDGCLTPMRAFNTAAVICDNPTLPEQHAWPISTDTVMECVMNNLSFNSILSYTTGWPNQFPDNPEALVSGELTMWSKQAWETAQNFPSGRAYRSNTVSFNSRLHLQENVFLAKIPVGTSKYHLLCPLPWEDDNEHNFQNILANIVSLHHLARQIHGKTVKQIKTGLFQLIQQQLTSVIAMGRKSWTAPLLETSRHMSTWNMMAVAATQPTPSSANGKVLKWLGSVRFIHLLDKKDNVIEIADDDTTFLQFHEEETQINFRTYGNAIKKYSTVSAYATWAREAIQNPFKAHYCINGKHFTIIFSMRNIPFLRPQTSTSPNYGRQRSHNTSSKPGNYDSIKNQ